MMTKMPRQIALPGMYPDLPVKKKQGYNGGLRTRQSGLDCSIAKCQERVAEAHYLGWTALERSWQADLDKLEALRTAGRTESVPSLVSNKKRRV